MIKLTTFNFNGNEVPADVFFVIEQERRAVIVKINDEKLRSEFMANQLVFAMAGEGIFVRENTNDLRYDLLLDSITTMLIKEYPDEIKKVVKAQ